MRDEGDRRGAAERGELLLDLGPVAVALGLVGEGVLGHRGEVDGVVAAAPVAGGALHRRDVGLGEQAAFGERRQGEQARGRVAAGRGDQLRLAQLVPVELGEPVDGALEQLGGAVLAVPALVGGQVAQAEVGGEVDDEDAEAAQRGDGRRGGAVRVGDDRRVDVLERVEVELGQLDRHAVARVELFEPLAGVAARGGGDQLQLRVAPDELGGERAGEAGGAGDEDPGRGLAVERLRARLSHGASPRSRRGAPRSRRAARRPPRR